MIMTLLPGEVFQHTHSDPSVTTLIEGVVALEVEGQRTELVTGAPTPIDAHLVHTLVNVGPHLAVVECMHKQGEPPTA